VFNLAATRPDLLTGVDPATGKPAPYGPVGVDINGGRGGECPASDGAVSTLPAGAGHHVGPVSSIHRIREHDACTKAGESDLRSHIVSTGGFIMHVSALVWAITLVTMIVIFAVDLLIVGRRLSRSKIGFGR
jgi:hypothetical protein